MAGSRKSLHSFRYLFSILCLLGTSCSNSSKPGLGGDSGSGLDGLDGIQSGPSTDGVNIGDGDVGGFDYAGNGNQMPTAEEQSAFAGLAPQLQGVAPNATTAYPHDVIVGLQKVQAMEAKGQDTTAERMLLANEMLASCAQDITRLAPRPGEPLLGNWMGACTNGDSVVLAASVTGQYPQSTGGQPAGNPKLSIVAISSTGSTAAGNITVKSDGSADSTVQAQGSVWAGKMTDQPQAATGTWVPVSGSTKCKEVKGQLVKSNNPIPTKYQEATKRLGQCYRQAMVLVSPILSGYVYNLTPSSAKAVTGAMNLQ